MSSISSLDSTIIDSTVSFVQCGAVHIRFTIKVKTFTGLREEKWKFEIDLTGGISGDWDRREPHLGVYPSALMKIIFKNRIGIENHLNAARERFGLTKLDW